MSMHAYRPIDADMPHLRESADWGTDPDSGSRIIRLTSSVAMSNNIYCEQPYVPSPFWWLYRHGSY